MVTLGPSSLVGALEPWESSPSHKRAPVARLVPLISSQDPELKVPRLPKSVRLPMEVITGVPSVQVPLPPVDVRLNCTLKLVPATVAVMTTGPAAPSLMVTAAAPVSSVCDEPALRVAAPEVTT